MCECLYCMCRCVYEDLERIVRGLLYFCAMHMTSFSVIHCLSFILSRSRFFPFTSSAFRLHSSTFLSHSVSLCIWLNAAVQLIMSSHNRLYEFSFLLPDCSVLDRVVRYTLWLYFFDLLPLILYILDISKRR